MRRPIAFVILPVAVVVAIAVWRAKRRDFVSTGLPREEVQVVIE